MKNLFEAKLKSSTIRSLKLYKGTWMKPLQSSNNKLNSWKMSWEQPVDSLMRMSLRPQKPQLSLNLDWKCNKVNTHLSWQEWERTYRDKNENSCYLNNNTTNTDRQQSANWHKDKTNSKHCVLAFANLPKAVKQMSTTSNCSTNLC